MCGLGGILYFDGRPVELSLIRKLSEAMRERGPDDEGIFLAPGIGLVHRRLSIIDLSPLGRCPMSNEKETIQLVYNGEVYNFLKLKEELSKRGHHFHSRSDAEVIIHGYEEWGQEIVKKLDGMFAFALWDAVKKILLLSRDRIGEKPLYYAFFPNGIIFASSLSAIHASINDKLNLNPKGIVMYLSYGYIPCPITVWKEVRQLAPAHYLMIEEAGRWYVQKYWDFPNPGTSRVIPQDVENYIEEKLDISIQGRLIADVPVGGFLSGGVDSSLVMALAAKHMSKIHTFSIGFKETRFNELPYARHVADSIGSRHQELIVSDKDLLEILPELVWHYGQPYGDSSCIPTYLISRFARKTVKVCLSGDGGDESFAGYRRALVAWYASLWGKTLPKNMRRLLRSWMCTLNRNFSCQPSLLQKAYRLNELSFGNKVLVLQNSLSWLNFLSDICGDFLMETIQNEKDGEQDTQESDSGDSEYSILQQVLYDDFKIQLPNDFLIKVDVASMAASLEVRTPFLDHHLIEAVWELPDNLKLRWGRNKWLLKRIAARYVPKSIISRKKMGFAIPMKEWWNGSLEKLLRRLLDDSRAVSWGWIKAHPVKRALEEHIAGVREHDTRLWLILWLELWARIYLEGSLKKGASLFDLAA